MCELPALPGHFCAFRGATDRPLRRLPGWRWATAETALSDADYRLIRSWAATDASRHDGALLPALIDKDNTASDVGADTAYRSKANEKHLANNGLRSQIHRKKPKGKPMSRRTARANGRKSAVRASVEHVFARRKGPMGLYIRTIGLARARTKIGLANLVYNLWTPPAARCFVGLRRLGA